MKSPYRISAVVVLLLALSGPAPACLAGAPDSDNPAALFSLLVPPDILITSFQFPASMNSALIDDVTGTINHTSGVVEALVPYATDVSALVPVLGANAGSISPASGEARDFRAPVTYRLSVDDRERLYEVRVTILPNPAKAITTFSFLDADNAGLSANILGDIDENAKAILVTVPFGVNRNGLIPNIAISGESITPAGGVSQDFTSLVVYTVTAANGTTQDYIVFTINGLPSDKTMTGFTLTAAANAGLAADVSGVIDEGAVPPTAKVEVPFGTSLANLVPTVFVSGQSVSPASGVAGDFTNSNAAPIQYTVTAVDTSTRVYDATVYAKPNITVSNLRDGGVVRSGFLIGTAADDKTVAAVEVSIDGGAYAPAAGTTNWKYQLPSGASTWKLGAQHVIRVRSRDNDGIYSEIAVLNIRKGVNRDVNGDGYADMVAGANGFASGTGPGRVYVYHGSASGIPASAARTLDGASNGDAFGSALALGDVNGDGFADLVVGAPGYTSGTGRVYVHHGSASGIAASASRTLTGASAGDSFGAALVLGDINGDGYADLAAGAENHSGRGRVYIYHGSAAGIPAASSAVKDGEAAGDLFGGSLALGQVNGDAFGDLIVSSRNYGSATGRVYVYQGAAAGLGAVSPSTLTGENTGDAFGRGLALGDVNGDGFTDLFIGADNFNGRGRVYHYASSAGGVSITVSDTFDGETAGDLFGRAIALGDVNGDGFADLFVGAESYSSARGRAYYYPGALTGPAAAPARVFDGENTGDRLGRAMGTGDVNGDGYPDFMLSAGGHVSGANRGRAYIYHGASSGPAVSAARTLDGVNSNDCFACALAP